MKILVYGTKDRACLLISLLKKEVPLAEIVCPENLGKLSNLKSIDYDDLDIAFIDWPVVDEEWAYKHIREIRSLPIVAVVNGEPDWMTLCVLGLYGYLCLDGNIDLVVWRLNAILRRLPWYSGEMAC